MIKTINGTGTINSNHEVDNVDSGTTTKISNQYQTTVDYSIYYPTSGGNATIKINSVTFKAIGSSNWYPNITFSDSQLYLRKYLNIDIDKYLSTSHQICSNYSGCQVDTRNNKITALYTNLQYSFDYNCIKGNKLHISAGCRGGLYASSTGNDVVGLILGFGIVAHEIRDGNPDYFVIDIPPTQSVYIRKENIWKRAFVWIKHLSKWKRCIIWKKINGIWKKGG